MEVYSHGARVGVTGSCHELKLNATQSFLIDCGLFQGSDASGAGADETHQEIEFPIAHIEALIVTHCHIDHVGRLPWLLVAGFSGPIYCTRATAHLLPFVIEDALKVGITRNRDLIEAVVGRLKQQLRPVDYNIWESVEPARIRFRQAGHILGSSFVEVEYNNERVVFSGDLGCKNTPLLPDPAPLEFADLLVIESTYGNRNHENRETRQQRLKSVIERCVADRGAVLIPAFSIGRTQELLYELEDIIHQCKTEAQNKDPDCIWKDMVVILDSPMAAQFTQQYRRMKDLWDAEAKERLAEDRHPLNFERMHIVDSHTDHERLVNYLKSTADPCIVIAASGMCTGGRMVNYLQALLPDPRTDVLFVGYQAAGTPGRIIQTYGPRGGYVDLDDQRIWIKGQVYTLGGYSAHADQQELLEFIGTADYVKDVQIVHGDDEARAELAYKIRERFPQIQIRNT